MKRAVPAWRERQRPRRRTDRHPTPHGPAPPGPRRLYGNLPAWWPRAPGQPPKGGSPSDPQRHQHSPRQSRIRTWWNADGGRTQRHLDDADLARLRTLLAIDLDPGEARNRRDRLGGAPPGEHLRLGQAVPIRRLAHRRRVALGDDLRLGLHAPFVRDDLGRSDERARTCAQIVDSGHRSGVLTPRRRRGRSSMASADRSGSAGGQRQCGR